jgi:hypothetical protein
MLKAEPQRHHQNTTKSNQAKNSSQNDTNWHISGDSPVSLFHLTSTINQK